MPVPQQAMFDLHMTPFLIYHVTHEVDEFVQTEVYATGEKLFEDMKLVIEGVVSLAAQSMMTDMNTGAVHTLRVYVCFCIYAVCIL
jgi:hypothetical protein